MPVLDSSQIWRWLFFATLFPSALVKGQEPYGSTHSHSNGFDTVFLPDTTQEEVATELTFNSVDGIWHDGDRAYLAADNKLTTFDNGVSTGTPVPIDGCTPERFERPRSATGPWYLHCESDDNDGTPQYVYLGQLRHLPTTGDYLPVRKNSILSRGVDSDGERTTALVVIDRDARDLRVFTQVGRFSTFLHTVDLSQHCDSISGIHYQEPLNGRIRAIISCFQEEELKYYAIKLSDTFYLESANLLQAPGNVLSVITHGDHVCTVDTSSLTCYVTTLPTRAPDLLTFDDSIANAAFLETSAGVFLLVEINGAEQMVFVVSPDGIGERFPLTNSQAHCSDGCLPYLVIDDHLLLFKQNGVYYKAYLYDLGAPSNGPTYRGRARFQPRFVAFQSQQAPITPDPPPTPQPTASTFPPSSILTPVPTAAPSITSTHPSSPTLASHPPPVPTAVIVTVSLIGPAILIAIVLAITGIVECIRRRKHVKLARSVPMEEKNPNASATFPPGYGSLSSNTSACSIPLDQLSHDSVMGVATTPLPFSDNSPLPPAVLTTSFDTADPRQANKFSHSTSELVPGHP